MLKKYSPKSDQKRRFKTFSTRIQAIFFLRTGGQSAPLWEQAKTIRFEDETPPQTAPPDHPKSPLQLSSKNLKLSASTTCLTSTPNPPPTTTPNMPEQSQPLNKSVSSLALNSSINKSVSSLALNNSNSGQVLNKSGISNTRRLSLSGVMSRNRSSNYSDSSSSEAASPTESSSTGFVLSLETFLT